MLGTQSALQMPLRKPLGEQNGALESIPSGQQAPALPTSSESFPYSVVVTNLLDSLIGQEAELGIECGPTGTSSRDGVVGIPM